MVAAVRFVAALLGVTAAVVVADEYFEGDGTSYTLGQVRSGNCNFMSAIPTASTNFVALNQEQWNTLGNCGRCIEVSCVDQQCTVQNKTAVVQVLDRCPECAHGALDLSPTVYKDITGLGPNRLTVRWRFVDCPDPGNVQVCLKEGSSSSWIAVQPTNGLVGVKSVTVNGAATTMLDGAYYYVSTTANADLSAVKVAMTSINGDVISGTYSLKVGKCTDTNQQFGSDYSPQSQLQTTPATTDALATTPTPVATAAIPDYSPVTQDSQGPSTETTPKATTAPDTPEAQGPSTQTTKKATTALDTPESQGPNTEASLKATTAPDTPEAQGPSTEVTPEATRAPMDAPTKSGDTSKCHVRGHRHRN